MRTQPQCAHTHSPLPAHALGVAASSQRSVTLSSAEAEFFGAMLAAKEVIFIRELLIDLGFSINSASVINCDSKSAVGMAFDPVAFKKTKHILRAAEFLRDLVSRGVISVEHLPGVVMIADLLTKAASRAIFTGLIKQLDDTLSCPLNSFVPRAPHSGQEGLFPGIHIHTIFRPNP